MWDAWKFARICQRFGWSAWRAPYEARQEGISPEAESRAGWPNEVSPQGRKSPSGHHRLLVPGRRFAQAEHRHGHPDRLRYGRTRNVPAARCACREAVRLGERSELRSSRKAPRRQVPRRAPRGALRSKVTRGCAVSNKIESLVAMELPTSAEGAKSEIKCLCVFLFVLRLVSCPAFRRFRFLFCFQCGRQCQTRN